MLVSLTVAGSPAHSPGNATVLNVVISLAVLALILYRQVQVRRAAPNLLLPAVVLVIGVVELAQSSNHLTSSKLGILVALLVVDAVGLGAVRALTVRLWRDAQGILRQGTWVTVVLWLVGLGIHEGVDAIAHIPAATTLLYVGVTFLAQLLVLQTRISRMEQQPPGPQVPGPHTGPATAPTAGSPG